MLKKTDRERFEEKVAISESGCWEWTGWKNSGGYGHFHLTRPIYKDVRASHASLRIYKNVPTLPHGVCALHVCDNPGCVNPDHLFLGTNADNTHDMMRKGRAAAGEFHPSTKLKRSDIIEIRKEVAKGKRFCEIAPKYGVSYQTISRIAHGQSWTHV